MPVWLKLYDAHMKVSITVRADAIMAYRGDPHGNGTIIWVGSTNFYVRETAEQIRTLLGAE